MLRASACHNYSPQSLGDGVVGGRSPVHGGFVAETRRNHGGVRHRPRGWIRVGTFLWRREVGAAPRSPLLCAVPPRSFA